MSASPAGLSCPVMLRVWLARHEAVTSVLLVLAALAFLVAVSVTVMFFATVTGL
jgi:hypothetical protein